ncbi:MAG: rhodanese-like domain-containing protein [Cyclobacteriaceae bacterium]
MKIEQIYTGCLSQGAYYIQSGDEAVIIDPLREIDSYLKKAEKDGVTIKYIFETHFHADFVSGHVSLAKKTGATIVYGPTAQTTFDAHIAKDGEEFKVGKLSIQAIHTPGHTLESTTYLLKDEERKDIAIFTGDTLFLGDVGRPDLAQKSDLTQDDLAGMLYDSLRNKIMPLADDITVYPAHGAGSACGKHMMKETIDTLGNQKKMNYALRANMTKEEFVKEVTNGLLPPPAYFPLNVQLNKEGYDALDVILEQGKNGLSPSKFEELANTSGALLLDVRNEHQFVKGHIPNSIFIGLNGTFAPWVGQLIIDIKQSILLIVDEGSEEEAITRLARVGFDHTLGYLKGGITAWKKAGREIDTITSISSEEYATRIDGVKDCSFDVRKESEYETNRVDGIPNTPLHSLNDFTHLFPTDKNFYLHCGGGYRSVIAASILKARGTHNAINVEGGFKGMKEAGIKTVN